MYNIIIRSLRNYAEQKLFLNIPLPRVEGKCRSKNALLDEMDKLVYYSIYYYNPCRYNFEQRDYHHRQENLNYTKPGIINSIAMMKYQIHLNVIMMGIICPIFIISKITRV